MAKKNELLAQAKQNVRRIQPERHLAETQKKRREVKAIAYSLYPPEIAWVNQTAQDLQRAGNPMANRSLVVREAILRLKEELENKSPEQMLHDFNQRHARRNRDGGL